MIVQLTWAPGSNAISQTVQYRLTGTIEWTTHSIINNNTTNTASLTIPQGSYDFRILNCETCSCPSGFVKDSANPTICISTTSPIPATTNTTVIPITRTPYEVYGTSGTRVFQSANDPNFTANILLNINNTFWRYIHDQNVFFNLPSDAARHNYLLNDAINGPVNRLAIWGRTTNANGDILNNYSSWQTTSASSNGARITVASTAGLFVGMRVSVTAGTGSFPGNTTVTQIDNNTTFWVLDTPQIPLVNASLLAKMSSLPPLNTFIGFDACINVPSTRTYYIALAADNHYQLLLDGRVLLTDTRPTVQPFTILHIYPVTISSGFHIISMLGRNSGQYAGFGCEIYDLGNVDFTQAAAFLEQQTNYNNINVVFTTRNMTSFTSNTTSCPSGFVKKAIDCSTTMCIPQSVNCTNQGQQSNIVSITDPVCVSPIIQSYTLS